MSQRKAALVGYFHMRDTVQVISSHGSLNEVLSYLFVCGRAPYTSPQRPHRVVLSLQEPHFCSGMFLLSLPIASSVIIGCGHAHLSCLRYSSDERWAKSVVRRKYPTPPRHLTRRSYIPPLITHHCLMEMCYKPYRHLCTACLNSYYY